MLTDLRAADLGTPVVVLKCAAGVDLGRTAYLDLTGQPVAAGPAVPGRRFLAGNYDPAAALAYWRAGEPGPAAWAASVRGPGEAAWFARDDLMPFGFMCLRMGWRAASRRWSRGPSVLPRAAGGPRIKPGRAARPGRRRAVTNGAHPTGPGPARDAESSAGSRKAGVRA